ncbi:MAG: zinc and cadmium transporter [Flavobacteriales bacterium]|jgi:zinc and cadmium transporter
METDIFTILVLFLAPFVTGIIMQRIKNQNAFVTKLLLSFSGAYLLGMCFLHLVPEVYHSIGANTGIWILVGFFLQIGLEFISKGIEHGHVHIHAHENFFPWALLISLCVHSFFEGFPMQKDFHNHDGYGMLLGVTLHKIPVAIALVSLLKQAKLSVKKQYMLLLLFCLMAPFGVFANQFFNMNELAILMPITLALLIGILLHVATTILFEVNENHKFNAIKFLTILIGAALSFIMN